MRLPVAVAMLVAFPAVTAVDAAEPRQASGKFLSRNWEFEPAGAYAYPGKVGFDDEAGIVVAISNSSFDAEFFDRYWDRDHAIETYQKSDQTLVAFFQFGTNGAYKGMTYSFGSGDGCGFCYDGSVQSTVKVEKGRIHGQLKLVGKPDELAFDLEFDAPVASPDHGTALPANGGEPGAVYAAYHQAMVAGDWDKLKPFYSDKLQGDFAEKKEQIVGAFSKDHPWESVRVERGFTSGDRALLLTEGEASYGKVKTEVLLKKEGSTWRIVDEVLQIRMGD